MEPADTIESAKQHVVRKSHFDCRLFEYLFQVVCLFVLVVYYMIDLLLD